MFRIFLLNFCFFFFKRGLEILASPKGRHKIKKEEVFMVLRKPTHKSYGKHIFFGFWDFVFLKSSAAKKDKKK